MEKNSARIHSRQTQPHEALCARLEKYRTRGFQKPIARHTLAAFARAEQLVRATGQPLILDSGCGVGASTVCLARRFPDHFVLGIDKSVARLAKHHAYRDESVANYALVRADLIDFWRLAARHDWHVARHYLFYPNPWPKKSALTKRFHGHPVFWDLIKLGDYFEVRSNWEIYLREFEAAFFYCSGQHGRIEKFVPRAPLTPFEKKYQRSGHELFRLEIVLASRHEK